jgi:hypothetical protein
MPAITSTSSFTTGHSDLTGVTSGQHHAQAHQASHVSGGSDAISSVARIFTGTYTGNGSTSQGITGIGFRPKYVVITARKTATDGTPEDYAIVFTTDVIVDDVTTGAAWTIQQNASNPDWAFYDDQIISLDADGFTVDDNGVDAHPNKNSQVYNYMAIG